MYLQGTNMNSLGMNIYILGTAPVIDHFLKHFCALGKIFFIVDMFSIKLKDSANQDKDVVL